MKPLFEAHERPHVVIVAAGIAMHALVASGKTSEFPNTRAVVLHAFALGEAFIEEAERRAAANGKG